MPRGAKPGERRGGRQKGTPNRKTVVRRELVEQAIEGGTSPLEYMLNIMRDETQPVERRDEMARAAAPFVHPKLSNIEGTMNAPPALPFERVEWVVVDVPEAQKIEGRIHRAAELRRTPLELTASLPKLLEE